LRWHGEGAAAAIDDDSAKVAPRCGELAWAEMSRRCCRLVAIGMWRRRRSAPVGGGGLLLLISSSSRQNDVVVESHCVIYNICELAAPPLHHFFWILWLKMIRSLLSTLNTEKNLECGILRAGKPRKKGKWGTITQKNILGREIRILMRLWYGIVPYHSTPRQGPRAPRLAFLLLSTLLLFINLVLVQISNKHC
jgi:hypothetical protein